MCFQTSSSGIKCSLRNAFERRPINQLVDRLVSHLMSAPMDIMPVADTSLQRNFSIKNYAQQKRFGMRARHTDYACGKLLAHAGAKLV